MRFDARWHGPLRAVETAAVSSPHDRPSWLCRKNTVCSPGCRRGLATFPPCSCPRPIIVPPPQNNVQTHEKDDALREIGQRLFCADPLFGGVAGSWNKSSPPPAKRVGYSANAPGVVRYSVERLPPPLPSICLDSIDRFPLTKTPADSRPPTPVPTPLIRSKIVGNIHRVVFVFSGGETAVSNRRAFSTAGRTHCGRAAAARPGCANQRGRNCPLHLARRETRPRCAGEIIFPNPATARSQ